MAHSMGKGVNSMKTPLSIGLCLALTCGAAAQSNVDSVKKFAWTENCGWTNWRDANGGTQGVNVGGSFLRGFVWGENVGWINTGNGSGPYLNTDDTNFGVNIGVGGFLSGFAWGENIGWVNFGTQAQVGAQGARYDASTRRFRGYAWGENIGWINLDDATAAVFAPGCCPGNADANTIVNFSDITAVLANFGANFNNGTGTGDADCNGVVTFSDITSVLANFGTPCP